jgi:hypothetical protein
LALNHRQSGTLQEANLKFRETGWLPTNGDGTSIFDAAPVCFMRAAHLKSIVNEKRSKPLHERLKEPLSCGYFTTWIQGDSPKEHREMIRDGIIQRWQEQQAAEQRKWAEDQAAKQEKRDTRRDICMIIGLAISAIGAATSAFKSSPPPPAPVIKLPDQPAPVVNVQPVIQQPPGPAKTP